MKIPKIPDTFMGVPVSNETLKRVLEGTAKPAKPKTQGNSQPANLDGFDYIDSIGLYVARERTLQDKNWHEAHEELQKQGYRMLTIPEFNKYLLYARANLPDVYEDITAVRNPVRGERLDAYFERRDDGLYVLTENKTKAEKLDDNTLMKYRIFRISLKDWLNNPTKQGLPRKDVKSGSLHYWHPINSRVARFGADSVGTLLVCDLDPDGPYSWLWVHPAKKI